MSFCHCVATVGITGLVEMFQKHQDSVQHTEMNLESGADHQEFMSGYSWWSKIGQHNLVVTVLICFDQNECFSRFQATGIQENAMKNTNSIQSHFHSFSQFPRKSLLHSNSLRHLGALAPFGTSRQLFTQPIQDGLGAQSWMLRGKNETPVISNVWRIPGTKKPMDLFLGKSSNFETSWAAKVTSGPEPA